MNLFKRMQLVITELSVKARWREMLWILITVAVICLALLCLERWQKCSEIDQMPGPKGIFLLANTLDFLMDPVKVFYYFRTLANQYKHLFKLNVGFRNFVLIYNPEDVETVISGARNNSKGFLYRFMKPWLQDGLLLSDGSKWQQRRKILTPTFHFNILRHFHPILEESVRKMVEQLRSEVDKPATDVSAFITDYTLNSICETAMGTKLDPETSDFGKRYKNGIHTLGQIIVYRCQRVWMYPNWMFNLTSLGRKQKELLHLLRSFRDSVINKRRKTTNIEKFILDEENCDDDNLKSGKKRLAMLDLLLQAEKDGVINAKGIGEEVDTFMFEGHDTTATALQFALMTLANNQEAQAKVVEECDQIFGSSDRAATMNDLGQMKYLECCIKESLRLYPPVHFFMRTVSDNLKLKNFEVPAGTHLAVLVYDLHRRDDQFVEALEFRPERFLTEPTWHPYSYIPFSAGPRNCIGQKFAMMEMKLALSAVLRRYRLLPVTTPRDIVFITDFILRPTKPILVKLQMRH